MQAFAEPQPTHDVARDEAFEELYRSYARDVYRYTLALLRNPADAEDVTQTTFLNAYRAYLRGEEPIRPRNWLIKIAHNACRSRHLRAVRRPQEVPLEETVAALPVPAEDAPKVQELLEALGRLPFNQRAALVMRELEGRSYVEIAQTLDVSVAAVETLIFRARRSLRREPSLLGALGAVQLPSSLSSLVGGGGGGAAAVAGGGAVAGSGLVAKAALLVAAGLVAGTVGTTVESRLVTRSPNAAAVLAPPPLLVRGANAASVPVQVEVTRRKTTERGTVLRVTRRSPTRASRTAQPVFGSSTGSSHQSSSTEGGAAQSGVPAASAPTASTEAPSSSSSSPSPSPVNSPVDDVTSAAPPPPSVEPPALPPVPPPPALPVATPSVPEPPATPSLPPPPPLPDLP